MSKRIKHEDQLSPKAVKIVVVEDITKEVPENDNDTLPRDELKNGPINDRGCTDVLCLLLLIFFTAGMVAIGGYGYLYGDYHNLLQTFDFDGNSCGLNGTETSDYPYIYWPMIDLEAA